MIQLIFQLMLFMGILVPMNETYDDREMYVLYLDNGESIYEHVYKEEVYMYAIENQKTARSIAKLYRAWEDYKNENKMTLSELEATLYSLRTFKKVEAEFPKAAEHLPKNEVSNALVKDIRLLENKLLP